MLCRRNLEVRIHKALKKGFYVFCSWNLTLFCLQRTCWQDKEFWSRNLGLTLEPWNWKAVAPMMLCSRIPALVLCIRKYVCSGIYDALFWTLGLWKHEPLCFSAGTRYSVPWALVHGTLYQEPLVLCCMNSGVLKQEHWWSGSMNHSASVQELATLFHKLWYRALCIRNSGALLH